MKTCTKCKIEKEVTEFNKAKKYKDGLYIYCKSCRKEYREANKERLKEWKKEYYQANKERVNERNKKYYEVNKERINEQKKQYRKENKEYIKEWQKEWRQANKEYIKEYKKEYREVNKEYIKEWQKEYRKENKERLKEKAKEWYQVKGKKVKRQYLEANKERLKEKAKEWKKQRKATDPLFKMKINLRSRTSAAFKNKGYSKNTKTQEILGVDWEVAKQHIERQFTKGMNWDNYGEWHIDHIIPLASANNEVELKKLCHYSNLQPLWAEDNLEKKDKITGQQVKFRI